MTSRLERHVTPAWLPPLAGAIDGLDLLGLRQPVQSIGTGLLNGITTITPTIRYVSLRAWLVHCYAHLEPQQPDSERDFVAWARQAEAVFAMANLAVGGVRESLIGPVKGAELLQEGGALIALEPLTAQPAMRIYANPTNELGITLAPPDDPTGAPRLSEERGAPLTTAVAATWGATTLGSRVAREGELALVSREELVEFGEVARADRLTLEERDVLVDAVIPSEPRSLEEWHRLATYTLLLWLAESLTRRPTEDDLFAEACSAQRRAPEQLHRMLDGWLAYVIRDQLAFAHERLLDSTLGQLRTLEAEVGIGGVTAEQAVRRTLAAAEVRDPFADAGLLPTDEFLHVEVDSVRAQVRTRIGDHVVASSGIRRWGADLSESRANATELEAAPGSTLLTWLLIEQRLSAEETEDGRLVDSLSSEGLDRIGVRQVLLPTIARWVRENATIAEALADLVYLTADQHVRIATLRLARDASRDVALLIRDGARWQGRGRDFAAGRTASRIGEAVDWLRQLRLLTDSGVTEEGKAVLTRALASLRMADS